MERPSIVLRPWTVDDAEWYAATVVGDPLIQRFTSESPTLTADEVRAAIVELQKAPPGTAGFLIADGNTGQRLGNIALRDGEVSYWVAGEARGRGVAVQALRLLADWARDEVPELRLWTHADNHGSRAVAERAGYVRDTGRDRLRQVKGDTWPTVAYVCRL